MNENLVEIYTDGACSPNPGVGGWGVILVCKGSRKTLSGGFKLSTNNRMEIYSAIAALNYLKEPCSNVVIYSDSQYLVGACEKGWLLNWHCENFINRPNADLWRILYKLLSIHKVHFEWVRGHGSNQMNEECDRLAVSGRSKPVDVLPDDDGYLKSQFGQKLDIPSLPGFEQGTFEL